MPDVPLKEPDPLLAEGKPTQPHPSSSPSRLSDLWEAQILLGVGGYSRMGIASQKHKSILFGFTTKLGNSGGASEGESFLLADVFLFFSGLLNITSSLAWFCPSGPKIGHLCTAAP